MGFNCKFIVGTSTGACFIPMMNRKKLLAIDILNFGDVMHWTNSLIPIIIFKKIIHKNSGKYLKFAEVIKLGIHKEYFWENKKNYSIYGWEDNNKYEIYNAINEMNNYCDNKLNLNYENALHKKLYKNFIKNINFDFPHFISSYFFEKNSNLFN